MAVVWAVFGIPVLVRARAALVQEQALGVVPVRIPCPRVDPSRSRGSPEISWIPRRVGGGSTKTRGIGGMNLSGADRRKTFRRAFAAHPDNERPSTHNPVGIR